MSKRTSLSAVLAVAAIVALPAVSQAGDCRPLDRVGAGAAAVVDGTARVVRRAGEAVVRTGDRVVGWVFHRRNRV